MSAGTEEPPLAARAVVHFYPSPGKMFTTQKSRTWLAPQAGLGTDVWPTFQELPITPRLIAILHALIWQGNGFLKENVFAIIIWLTLSVQQSVPELNKSL